MPTPDPTPPQRPSRPRTTNPASRTRRWLPALTALPLLALGLPSAQADDELVFPPVLTDGGTASRDHSDRFLQPPADATLAADIEIAATAPQIDLILYPGQNYPGRPWSTWGEGTYADGIYYSGIGDHLGPAGNALLFAYRPDPADGAPGTLETLLDLRALLDLPDDHYTPAKFHTALGMGRDGHLYAATHRGSTRVTTPENHFTGDWIVRHHPGDGRSEIVVQAPVPGHCIPSGLLDPERLIYYGATTPGHDGVAGGSHFFAYDIEAGRLLHSDPDGPSRGLALAGSSGRVYYTPGSGAGRLMRYDPATDGPAVDIGPSPGLRAASRETEGHKIYFANQGRDGEPTLLFELDTSEETVSPRGPLAVGSQQYVTSLAVTPDGRWLYYVPGAHGGAERDGSSVVQMDLQTGTRKVLAFLHPYYEERHGLALKGTYGVTISEAGDRLFITWNASRGSRAWDCCALTVIGIPPSERQEADW